jgi:hypothetical protein
MTRRSWPIVLGALLFGVVGPRLTWPHGKSAGEPFAWVPPDGFVEVHEPAADGEPEGRKWRLADPVGHAFVPRAEVTHSPSELPVDEAALAQIAAGMPSTFAPSGVTWTERRHEMRTRPDGARVGLLEGDWVKRADIGMMLMAKSNTVDVHARKLQLVFPDDTGTSIVTIDYGKDEAATWEPIFEASIAKAKGVATRVPAPPMWMYTAWGSAGLVLGWLASALLGSRREAETA